VPTTRTSTGPTKGAARPGPRGRRPEPNGGGKAAAGPDGPPARRSRGGPGRPSEEVPGPPGQERPGPPLPESGSLGQGAGELAVQVPGAVGAAYPSVQGDPVPTRAGPARE